MEQMQAVTVEAIDLTYDGLGVCKLEDGYTVFVENLLKGEVAKIYVTDRKSRYGFGKIIERISRSPYRVVPKCKHFYECGGCGLMHMDYDVQCNFKKYRIKSVLEHNELEDVKINTTAGMVNPYHYRNKVEIKFRQTEDGIKAGFFRSKSHELVDIEECYIMGKRSFELLNLFKNLCDEFSIRAYDDVLGVGVLKSAVIREANSSREMTLLLQTAKETFDNRDKLVNRLIEKSSDLVGIGLTVTDDESPMSKDPIHVLYGKDHVTEEIGDLTFEIGFRSFFQTNTLQAEKLLGLVEQYANLTGREKIIDAYCGIGSIGLYLAKKAHKVFGVEWIRSAITDARINARKNNIKNTFFEVGNVDQVMRKWRKFKFDVIVIDPPRKGVSKQTLRTIINMGIKRIIYISCDQATMGRDLKYLHAGGYDILEVTPVDMFPQTTQIESVSLLEKHTKKKE